MQILLLLLLRPFLLWYLGLSRIAKALESIDESLSYLPAVHETRVRKNRPPRFAA
ncbi:MAG TPA: hypothetical protein VM782_04325 [Stellaceae bacterium]|nr:hypothetical protein [Stellaceae bacterium]